MGFTVTNSFILRSCYGEQRNFCTKTSRETAPISKLAFADASALRIAVRKLSDYDYEDTSKEKLAEHVTAFIDSYNYTLESSKKSKDTDTINAMKQLKNVSEKYKKELENIGIKADKDGYLSISESAKKKMSPKTFSKVFGESNGYLSQVQTYAARIVRHIDISL